MAWVRHLAFFCWEILMVGIPMRWPSLPELLLNVMLALAAVGIVLWAANELFRFFRRSGSRRLEPSDIIAIGVVIVVVGALTIAGGGLWSHLSTKQLAGADATTASPISVSNTQSITPVKKTYPKRTRDDLANAMADLAEILNTHGYETDQQSVMVYQSWHRIVPYLASQKSPDVSEVIRQINLLSDASVKLNRAIEDNGFRRKYEPYLSEIHPVLGTELDATNTNPISQLQISSNNLRTNLEALQMIIEKHGEPRLIDTFVRGLGPADNAYMTAQNGLKNWLNQTKSRISAFNKVLQQGE